MDPFLTALAAARQDELRAAAIRHPPAPRAPARQRLGWWLMELGLHLATPETP